MFSTKIIMQAFTIKTCICIMLTPFKLKIQVIKSYNNNKVEGFISGFLQLGGCLLILEFKSLCWEQQKV